jgi:hypothetical protein
MYPGQEAEEQSLGKKSQALQIPSKECVSEIE